MNTTSISGRNEPPPTAPDSADAPGRRSDSAPRGDDLRSTIDRSASVRWWLAVVLGSFAALPLGWLLSYAAALPFMIGTFFFALLGLIIGAITFRAAGRHARYSRRTILAGTTIIVLIGWGYSIHVEAGDLPRALSRIALADARDLGDRTAEEFEAAVADGVRSYLKDRFAPGGTPGYVRWVVAQGQIPRGELPPASRTLSVRQHGISWLIRVGLSLGLLAFGVASQTWPLAVRRDPPTTA